MAKDERALEDLEDELAALEAELAALEGKPKKEKPPKKPKTDAPSHPEGTAPAEAGKSGRFSLPFKKDKVEKPAEASAPAGSEAAPEAKKPKLALPFGRKKKAQAEEAPTSPEAAPERAAPTDAAAAPEPARAPKPQPEAELEPEPEVEVEPLYDASLWRQDEGAWVRVVPGTEPRVVRRVLDEEDRVVREEAATPQDVDEVTGARAEKGVAKLLGNASGAASKLKGLRFGRKRGGGDDE